MDTNFTIGNWSEIKSLSMWLVAGPIVLWLPLTNHVAFYFMTALNGRKVANSVITNSPKVLKNKAKNVLTPHSCPYSGSALPIQ
jgi:hypothetical protein